MRETPPRKWLKKGCLGCAGFAVVSVLVIVLLMVVAWRQVQGDAPTTSILTRQPRFSTGSEPIVVDLDVAWAEVIVKAAAAGEPVVINANHDPNYYVLDVSTQEQLGSYRALGVRFAPSGSQTLAALRPLVGGSLPRLEVHLPVETPITLRVKLSGGRGLLDLGRLWLTEVQLDADRAVTQVQFRDPTAYPVRSMELVCRAGNMELHNLGHASPQSLVVHQGMGPGFIDLGGDWQADAWVHVSVAFGAVHLRLPEGVAVEGLEGHLGPYNHSPGTAGSEVGPPKLTMDVHFDAGDIRVSRGSDR